MKAMILLAINCGFGNTDIMGLPIKAVNLETSWVEFPRKKTATLRGCPLWSETVSAIREALAQRPRPHDRAHDGLLFITKYGRPWGTRGLREIADEGTKENKLVANMDDPVSKEFTKLLKTLGLKRKGVSFYALRHTFETIGGGSRDQVAVDAIMGHADESMAAVYREEIGEDRLKAVTDHARAWLFPQQISETQPDAA
jgi:integrase